MSLLSVPRIELDPSLPQLRSWELITETLDDEQTVAALNTYVYDYDAPVIDIIGASTSKPTDQETMFLAPLVWPLYFNPTALGIGCMMPFGLGRLPALAARPITEAQGSYEDDALDGFPTFVRLTDV